MGLGLGLGVGVGVGFGFAPLPEPARSLARCASFIPLSSRRRSLISLMSATFSCIMRELSLRCSSMFLLSLRLSDSTLFSRYWSGSGLELGLGLGLELGLGLGLGLELRVRVRVRVRVKG